MKKLFYFLLFLFLGTNCYSQDFEKLPDFLWEELVEMNIAKNGPVRKWGDSIHISIEGLYKTSDSLVVASVIKKLDSITETSVIRFVKTDDSNFRIKFLDRYVRKNRGTIGAETMYDTDGNINDVELNIYKIEKTDFEVQKKLENQIAKMLISGRFAYPDSRKKRGSIFNHLDGLSSVDTLNNEDALIIQEVYKKGFKKRLQQAEQQFKNVPKKLKNDKIRIRDKSLWWVKNPMSALILPIILSLVIFVFFIKKMNQILTLKIKKDWLLFGVISLIGLIFFGVLIIFFVSFYDFLTIPDDYEKVGYIRFDTILTTAVSLAMFFPFLFLFRFIELKIKKLQKSIFIKTALIFLSTGFLPFIIAVIFYGLFISKGEMTIDVAYLMLSKIFLYAMTIAIARALISYFIFKERNLVIDNETKLSALEALNAQAKVELLQSQINPHFLYNSLNSIASLAPVDTAKTQKMAYALSDLFKYTINRQGKKMSTVKDEVTMVKNYLEIEKIRFGDRLNFNIEVDKTLETIEIPLCLIQPLVENAVKHGISKNEGQGEVVLRIEKVRDSICIVILDNGPDFPEGLVSGHGLQTVYDLLRLTYGENASLNWQNTPEKSIRINITQTF